MNDTGRRENHKNAMPARCDIDSKFVTHRQIFNRHFFCISTSALLTLLSYCNLSTFLTLILRPSSLCGSKKHCSSTKRCGSFTIGDSVAACNKVATSCLVCEKLESSRSRGSLWHVCPYVGMDEPRFCHSSGDSALVCGVCAFPLQHQQPPPNLVELN